MRYRIALHNRTRFSVSVPGLLDAGHKPPEAEAVENIKTLFVDIAVVDEQLLGAQVREIEMTV